MYKKKPSVHNYHNEQFRDCPGNPFYKVSDKGRIWSHKAARFLALSESTPNTRRKPGEPLIYIPIWGANSVRKMVNLHKLREEIWPELYQPCIRDDLNEIDEKLSTLNAERSALMLQMNDRELVAYIRATTLPAP